MSQRIRPQFVLPAVWLAAGVPAGAPIAWLALGVICLFVLARRPEGADQGNRVGDRRREDELALRRQLAIARRRGHPADLLRAQVAGLSPDQISRALRISDFALLDARPDGDLDLVALMDGAECDRSRVEERLRGLGGSWAFGWSRFPEDGATLDALADSAAPTSRTDLLHNTTEGRP